MDKRVVVTGIGIVTPLDAGRGLETFWEKALGGGDCIARVTAFDVSQYSSKVAAEINGCGKIGRNHNRWIQIAKRAFVEAVEDASLPSLDQAGISLGTVLGGILQGERYWKKTSCDQANQLPPEYALSYGTNYFVNRYKMNGPAITVSTACASSTDAMGIAYRKILLAKSNVMIAGGADVLSEFAFSGFNILQAMTKEKVRPFDKNRGGLALGEGAAFVALEEEGHARRRQAKIYGRVLGYASRGDAHHLTGPDREGKGLSEAIRSSMKEAALKPSQIDYINAHGTGTPYNDAMETKAIKAVFGKDAYNIPISSIKSMIGHSFGAAGTIEAITCLLAIRDGTVPPTIHYEERDPGCDLDYVPNKARRLKVRSTLSLSAGFGGQNAAIVLGEAGH